MKTAIESPIVWPEGKAFAFSIFDDTDLATIENTAPVYDFLTGLGFRITKSAWLLEGDGKAYASGTTCEDRDYRRWVQLLQAQGHEIGFHGASYSTSPRERTRLALDRFREYFGDKPVTAVSHSRCEENMYWGPMRLTGRRRLFYNLATSFRGVNRYRGNVEGDPLFWGDLCRERVAYLRNFVFPEINTLRACPYMPYYDPLRPFVNAWFASTEGAVVGSFVDSLSEENQDRLEEQRGACIMYTHLACGFKEAQGLHGRFQELMERLSKKNGWFVPVGTLLNHIESQRGIHILTDHERAEMESRWFWRHKLVRGRS